MDDFLRERRFNSTTVVDHLDVSRHGLVLYFFSSTASRPSIGSCLWTIALAVLSAPWSIGI